MHSTRFPSPVTAALGIGLALCGLAAGCGSFAGQEMPSAPGSRLLATLPDACPTPEGMALDAGGNIVVACPNFAEPGRPAVLAKVDASGRARVWIRVPPHPETGVACPMGIAFGPDGALYVCDNQGWAGTAKGRNRGRILRLVIRDGRVAETVVVARGLRHPNGIRVRGDHLYVTQSRLPAIREPGGLVSGVYRFGLADRDVKVTNTREDPSLLAVFVTRNKAFPYGADGLVFDGDGRLYVANCGDAAIHRITFDAAGAVKENILYAQNREELETAAGLCRDAAGNVYVADPAANAVARVTPDGTVVRIAQSPDGTGAGGALDQPIALLVRGDVLVVSNFDLVTGQGKVNTAHDAPHTLSALPLTTGAPPQEGMEE